MLEWVIDLEGFKPGAIKTKRYPYGYSGHGGIYRKMKAEFSALRHKTFTPGRKAHSLGWLLAYAREF